MAPVIAGFDYQRITVADGVALHTAVAGSGSPVVLLHGFPQTHLMWRHVAPDLAADHTVICPDLRGYGASDKPAEGDAPTDLPTDGSTYPTTYAKRTMANDVVALARALGHDRFALAGHDRGALVAFRAGLDHPDTVTHLACLDVLPTLDMWDVMHGTTAAVGFHLYLMAQPPGLPERMIAASADAFFGHFLDSWSGGPHVIPADVRTAYLDACRHAVPSIVADYRASAGIDVDHDRADRDARNRLTMPVTVLQQDWGAALGFDAAALWRAWALDLHHVTVTSGHFMAEETPADVTKALRDLLAR
jgi:pimeloyl-ACP methyl ester carboxylesterase